MDVDMEVGVEPGATPAATLPCTTDPETDVDELCKGLTEYIRGNALLASDTALWGYVDRLQYFARLSQSPSMFPPMPAKHVSELAAGYLFREDHVDAAHDKEPHQTFDCAPLYFGPDAVVSHIPHALSSLTMDAHDKSSPYRCGYCHDHFEGRPWHIYQRLRKTGKWDIDKNFCSCGCMMKYLSVFMKEHPGLRCEWRQNCALVARKRLRLSMATEVPMADDIEDRADHGGGIPVKEWVERCGRNLVDFSSEEQVLRNRVSYSASNGFVFGKRATCAVDVYGDSTVGDHRAAITWITTYTDENNAARVPEQDHTPQLGAYGTREVPAELQARELCNEMPSAVYQTGVVKDQVSAPGISAEEVEGYEHGVEESKQSGTAPSNRGVQTSPPHTIVQRDEQFIRLPEEPLLTRVNRVQGDNIRMDAKDVELARQANAPITRSGGSTSRVATRGHNTERKRKRVQDMTMASFFSGTRKEARR